LRCSCPVDTFVFPELGRSRDGESLEARFNAFKIPESNFLVFEATVRTCRDGCQPAYCNSLAGRSEASFGRRKRSLNDTDIDEGGESVVSTASLEDSQAKKNGKFYLHYENRKTIKMFSLSLYPHTSETSTIKSSDEQVREMIEVFESREEMQQESIAKKMISADNESVCLSATEYYGLVISTMMLLFLLMSVAVIIGLLYRFVN